MLQIYNTLHRQKEVFRPIHPKKVSMYVCGMTVYDYCPIGHARVMIVFDMVVRWLRASGFEVTYVRNITDIDDKIIKKAIENKESIASLTQRFIDAMHEDSDALGVLRPDHEPRATHYISQMQTMISGLMDKQLAYQADSGDVMYSVRDFPDYGQLSGKSLDDLEVIASLLQVTKKILLILFYGRAQNRTSLPIHAGPLSGVMVDLDGILNVQLCPAKCWVIILIFMVVVLTFNSLIMKMKLLKVKAFIVTSRKMAQVVIQDL